MSSKSQKIFGNALLVVLFFVVNPIGNSILLKGSKVETLNNLLALLGISVNMLADSVPSPFNSIWVKLSISLAEAACSILLLFALYKLLGKCCPILSISYQRLVQNSINSENIETGVPFKLLQSVCAVKFSTEEMKRGDCAICLEEFGEGEWLRALPNCLHSFHIHCIDMWLSAHSDCPMCRKQVMGDLDESCSCIQISLEALLQEDVLRRVRPPDYYLVESEAIRNEAIGSDWRGIQSLMGL